MNHLESLISVKMNGKYIILIENKFFTKRIVNPLLLKAKNWKVVNLHFLHLLNMCDNHLNSQLKRIFHWKYYNS